MSLDFLNMACIRVHIHMLTIQFCDFNCLTQQGKNRLDDRYFMPFLQGKFTKKGHEAVNEKIDEIKTMNSRGPERL